MRLSIDETPLSTGQAVQLARGNHLVVLSGASYPAATPQLTWMAPGATGWQPIDERLIFAAPEGGNGLEATFYPTLDFQGSPNDTIVDPVIAHYYHVNPLARVNGSAQSWSVEWNGSIDLPTTGAYRFEADRLSRAGLWVDDTQVFDDTADGASQTQSGSAQLSAGRHQIRVRLQNRGEGGPRLYLYWTPPGGARELVPGRVLYPPPPR